MEVHPYATIFPLLTGDEFESLCNDIEANELRVPVLTYQGKILDGRNRARACEARGVAIRTEEFTGSDLDAINEVISLNQHRRHLRPGQAAVAAVRAKEFYEAAKQEAERRQAEGRKRGGELGGRPKKSENLDGKSSIKVPRVPEVATRDVIAKAFGTNGRYIDEAARLETKAPDLVEKVHTGEIKIAEARREAARREKKATLEAKAKEAETVIFGAGEKRDLGWEIINGDCLQVMTETELYRPRLIFADPPYNIGIEYGDHYDDRKDDDEYIQWATAWVRQCARTLADDGSLWVLIGDEYAAEYGCLIKDAGLSIRSWIIWYESFGVNCANKFNRTHRHLFYAVKDPKNFVFNADAVSRPSDRQLKYNDKRADPSGKVWDDVWGINPLIPRVVDNHSERIPDFPTQLPLSLLRPIIGCATDPGDLVLDPFNGSGTTGVACVEARRRYVGIELSEHFASLARMRLMALSGELAHAS